MHAAFPEDIYLILALLCCFAAAFCSSWHSADQPGAIRENRDADLGSFPDNAPSVTGDTPRYLRHSEGFGRSDKGPIGCAHIFRTGSHCLRELQISPGTLSGTDTKEFVTIAH